MMETGDRDDYAHYLAQLFGSNYCHILYLNLRSLDIRLIAENLKSEMGFIR